MKVEIIRIEQRTPNPDRHKWHLHASGVSMADLPVRVHLACEHTLDFENEAALSEWLHAARHRFERVEGRYIINCSQCRQCRDSFKRLSDGRVFVRTK